MLKEVSKLPSLQCKGVNDGINNSGSIAHLGKPIEKAKPQAVEAGRSVGSETAKATNDAISSSELTGFGSLLTSAGTEATEKGMDLGLSIGRSTDEGLKSYERLTGAGTMISSAMASLNQNPELDLNRSS